MTFKVCEETRAPDRTVRSTPLVSECHSRKDLLVYKMIFNVYEKTTARDRAPGPPLLSLEFSVYTR